ncbi:11554_t:CDS:2, partial [Diversispora eburnea]
MFQNNVIHVDEVTSYLALLKVHPDNSRKYLAISTTSTSSERLFSEAGNVMTIKRTQMVSNTLENLVF